MQKYLMKRLFMLPLSVCLVPNLISEASANVMFNTYGQYASNIGSNGDGDDGWNADSYGRGEAVAWVGTNNYAMPFGLTPAEVPFANWAVHLNSAGDNGLISSQNAYDLYGVWADLDSAAGAWKGTSSRNQGSIYSMDLGLIKSDITQQVTLSAANVNAASWQNFGISVYSGADQLHPKTIYEYSHDTCCDLDGNPVPVYGYEDYNYLSTMSHYGYRVMDPSLAPQDNPFGSDDINFLTHGEHSTVTFTAQADEVYVVLLGGNAEGSIYGDEQGYALNVTSAPVPIPGAVWLFASGLGLVAGVRRRKVL